MEAPYSHRSDKVDQIAMALCEAQGSFAAASKDSSAPIGKGYQYASLDSLIQATRPALSKHKLAFMQNFVDGPTAGTKVLESVLLHVSGQFIASTYRIDVASTKPHDIGSHITYARRYSMSAMLGIVCDEDDCGMIAQGVPSETAPVGDEAEWSQLVVARCEKAQSPAHLEQLQRQIDDANVAQSAKNKARIAHNKARLRLSKEAA